MSKWTDWIPHEGDECPVDGGEIVRVKFRQNGGRSKQDRTMPAGGWLWDYKNQPSTITHYKRLRKNVEAKRAKETKAAAEKSWTEANERANDEYAAKLAREASPKPIITGFGEYKTRDGQKAIVTSEHPGARKWSGRIEGAEGAGIHWHSNGLWLSTQEHPWDIVGPWIDEPEAPAPIITGPGEYVTRDGRKATIMGLLPDNSRWWGKFKGAPVGSLWCLDGACGRPDHPELDITGPWQEPEKAERWANLYRHENGELHLGWTVRSSAEKVLRSRAGNVVSKHIGAVLLNPEEE